MKKHFLSACLVYGLIVPSAHAQKPVGSVDVRFTDFAIPPYPVEVIAVSASPDGGLRYQTSMPIAGRMAATTDVAKLRGASTTSSGVYLYTGVVGATGQATLNQGMVFSPPNPRVKLAPDTPVDWAVWGTNSSDGPLRLPFGGDYDQLIKQVSTPTFKSSSLVSLISSGPGFNYENYASFPRYRTVVQSVDPTSGRLITRVEQGEPQDATNRAKLPRYIAVAGDSPEQMGQVIKLSGNRFEVIATRFVKDDKNASARQLSLLTFDDAGNLLKDQPVNFTYNRTLTVRIPVVDTTGMIVGTVNVFGAGPGKKDAQDPEENRFNVVVTDEKGGIWSQFDWTANGSSTRAVMPHYALRKGDKLLLYSTNQQKIAKPVEETWVFDRAGKATLTGTLAYDNIPDLSKGVGGITKQNSVGWYNYTTGTYVDSFTDANGEVWVFFQRFANPPVSADVEQAPVPAVSSAPVSRLMGFANKVNQMTGQSPQSTGPASTTPRAEFSRSNDLFCLHFGANMMLKQQTVVVMQAGSLRPKRVVTSTGVSVLMNDDANTLLTIKNGELSVLRLTPSDAVSATPSGTDNFVVDEAKGKLYLLYKLPKKAGQGRLLTYDLN